MCPLAVLEGLNSRVAPRHCLGKLGHLVHVDGILRQAAARGMQRRRREDLAPAEPTRKHEEAEAEEEEEISSRREKG